MTKLMSKTLLATVVCMILYILSFSYLDRTIALYCKNFTGTHLFTIGQYISYLADGNIWRIAIPLLLISVVIYDYYHGRTSGSKAFLYIIISILVASAIGGALKFLLGRYRPVMLYSQHLYGFHFLTKTWAFNSTPSGHSFRIFALMASLSLVFKRWYWLFFIVAICVGLSRIIVHAHYPSDVLFGAYIGLLAAFWSRNYIK